MNQVAKRDDTLQAAFFFGCFAAVLLIAIWLIFALIFWDFSVSGWELRMLVILSLGSAIWSFIYLKMT